MILKNKKAQEEMVGFALIIIIVAIIFVVFLSISLRSPQKEGVESYEVESFIQAFLQYHTSCEQSYETNYLTIQDLMFKCSNEQACLDDSDSCTILEQNLRAIIEESWPYGPDRPVKAYELKILSDGEELLILKDGEETNNYKSAVQDFVKSGNAIQILFTAYY